MEPLDLTGVKEYASEIAQPLRDRLVEDICRRAIAPKVPAVMKNTFAMLVIS